MIDVFWKIAYKLYKLNFHILPRIFELISFIISSHAISAQIDVGNNTKFYHHGLGCTVLQNTKIGANCIIFQNVTIGASFSKNKHGGGQNFCSIGNNCLIGTGAVILGNLNIGNNVRIGANSVVLQNLPDNCTAVGIPARIIKKD